MLKHSLFTPIPSNFDPYPETSVVTWAQIPGTGVWVVIGMQPYQPPIEFELPDAG